MNDPFVEDYGRLPVSWVVEEEALRRAIPLMEKFYTKGLSRREFIRLVVLLKDANKDEYLGAIYVANNIQPGD